MLQGDTLRIIFDNGDVETHEIGSVDSDTVGEVYTKETVETASGDASARSALTYHIVKEYLPQGYSRFEIEQVATSLSDAQTKDAVEFIDTATPSWVYGNQNVVLFEFFETRTITQQIYPTLLEFIDNISYGVRLIGHRTVTTETEYGHYGTPQLGAGFLFAAETPRITTETEYVYSGPVTVTEIIPEGGDSPWGVFFL